MTYRQLRDMMQTWDDQKLDCDLTIVDMRECEAFSAELSYVEEDDNIDYGLEDNHPFFYI